MEKNKSIQGHQNSQSPHQCGNCWGHQEYSGDFVEQQIDIAKIQKENFISKFVKKYIR